MQDSIKNKNVSEPFKFSAKGVIQNPQIDIVTKCYPISEKEYHILIERYWRDWLSPFAFALLGIFLSQLISLISYVIQIYIHIDNVEEVAKLKESQHYDIKRAIIIFIASLILFILPLCLNHICPTKKKTLLKKIRRILDEDTSIIARKSNKGSQ